MLGPQCFFPNGQRSAVERLSLRVFALVAEEFRQVVEASGEPGTSEGFCLLECGQEELLSVGILTALEGRLSGLVQFVPVGGLG